MPSPQEKQAGTAPDANGAGESGNGSSQSAATSEPPAPPKTASTTQPLPPTRRVNGRGLRLLMVLVLVVCGAVGYGAYWWLYMRGTVTTDDAYVEARIVSVASRLPERVQEVLIGEGEQVKRGQVLVRFASEQLRLMVKQMEASVRAAQSRLEQRRNGPRGEELQVAQAEVRVHEVDLALQEKELRRAERLARVQAISAQDLERRRSALESARSELEVSRSRLALLRAGTRSEEVRQAEAEVALAKAQLDAARTEMKDTELRSPLEGIVARRQVDPGEVVQKGQALFQIVETGRTWVVANLEEDQVTRVHEGQPAWLWIDAYPGREFRGMVGPVYAATISRFSLLPSSSASGNFIKVTQRVPVRIDWAPEHQADLPPMFPGLNVVVRIEVGAGKLGWP